MDLKHKPPKATPEEAAAVLRRLSPELRAAVIDLLARPQAATWHDWHLAKVFDALHGEADRLGKRPIDLVNDETAARFGVTVATLESLLNSERGGVKWVRSCMIHAGDSLNDLVQVSKPQTTGESNGCN
jgi:hypothetical protein